MKQLVRKIRNSLRGVAKKHPALRKLMRKGMYTYRRLRYILRGIGVHVDDKIVIFEAFNGKGYSDSPKAVYEFMKSDERYAGYKFIWIFKEPYEHSWLKDERTSLVKYRSRECEKALQQAKYWIFNYRALDHWVPTKKQVYVQCWHGVPLKRLGYDIKASDNAMNTLAEIQEKYKRDAKRFKYLLSSCEFATEKFKTAWNLEAFGKQEVIREVGYPRNDFLINHTKDDVVRIREKLGLSEGITDGKKIILYAPTWRDNQYDSSKGYTYDLQADFRAWQEQLGDEYIILFRAHYLVASTFDFEAYGGFIRDVSDVDDINELYVVSDMLVTDYSSVFFDYAILNRPIVFYMYDLEYYRDKLRGFYLGLDELPGEITYKQKILLEKIREQCPAGVQGEKQAVAKTCHKEFNQRFNSLNDGKATERLVENVIKEKKPKPIIANIFKCYKEKNEKLILSAFCFVKITKLQSSEYDFRDIGAAIGEHNLPTNVRYKKGIPFLKDWYLNKYDLEIDLKTTPLLDIQNKIIIKYREYNGRILFNILDYKRGKGRVSKVCRYKTNGIYFRQSVKNTLYLTVREGNYYDTREGQRKIKAAFLLSKIYKKNDLILLFEKECQRYEESASVLYEKLIELGYKNCYYIINKDNLALNDLDEKYEKNLIYKDSFKHILYFFVCKKFIGTETLGHAMQLRVANRRVIQKTQSKKLSYVFLQHGVMYMISLDSEMRVGFRNTKHKLYRVVVSSELEAEHFIELGGFDKKNLYITGLAKFDRSVLEEGADKIVIMPTWRRWESNSARKNFIDTKYYQMIVRIINGIPKQYRDKVVVLPHPLMRSAMLTSQNELRHYLPKATSYDEILKTCRVLITDYSSIAYDAFYRGSNVIFYWEEKEECIEHYGGNTRLMLDESNVFGDVCYCPDELSACFAHNYTNKQSYEYMQRYRKIVSFYDGKNTERIIEKLKKDRII